MQPINGEDSHLNNTEYSAKAKEPNYTLIKALV